MIFSKTKNYKNYKKNVFVFLFLLCFFSFFSAFKVDAARRMEAMAFITDKNGQPIDGEYSVRFAIYSTDRTITDSYPSDSDSGSRLWEENQIINIKKGILQFTLGQKQELPIFGNIQDGQFYLGIRINQDGEMVPRKRITPSLFAYDAINATLLNGKKIGVESGNIVALNDTGKINLQNLPIGKGAGQLITGNDSRLSGSLTLAGSKYLTLSNQKLTAKKIQLSSDTQGTLPISQGGTGLTDTQNGKLLIGTGSGYAFGSISGAGNVDVSTTNSIISISLKDTLSIGGLAIRGTVPSDVANHLYSNSGNLYWGNTMLGGGGGTLPSGTDGQTLRSDDSSNWVVSSVLFNDGVNVGIGTTSPQSRLEVNGVITVTGGDSNAWNIAYSWGNHSTQGYLTGTKVSSFNSRTGAVTLSSLDVTNALAFTPYNATNPNGYISSYTETDPIFNSSIAHGITNTNIVNWNAAYSWGDHALVGYLTGTKVDSFNSRTGAVALSGLDVTNALAFTPYNATNPNGYITASSLNNLTNKSGNISMWTNDAGYITSFAEVDPTLATWIGSANLSTLGTIATGIWHGNAITLNYGGTGLTSYTAGDMLYYSSGTALSKLAIGSNGQVLVVSAGAPAWSSTAPGAAHTFLSSSHSDTTIGTVQRGDVITGQGSTASWTRLPIGTLNQVLKSNGTDIYWGTDTDTDTTYSKSGTLLQQSGTVFSLKEGTLTDTKLCTYSTASGLVCDTLPATGGTTYTAGNDLDLSGTQFDLEPQLDYVTTINRTASNLTFQTTTSGHILISPADNVGIGTTTPTQKLQIVGYADATGLCINGSCKTSWTGAGIGTDYTAGNDIDITNGVIDLESQLDYVATINRTSNDLTLQTTTSGNIFLMPNQNVGIGTINPLQKVDVNGNLNASALYTNNTIRISNTGALTNVSGNISQFTNNMNYITDGNTNWDNSYNFITASSLDNLTNKSGNISMWTNNAGYLSSFTEVDPTLSAWTGSTNLATVGTITTGTWRGNAITTSYGGTGLASYMAGDLLYYASGTALSRLAVGTDGQMLVVTAGVPSWGTLGSIDHGSLGGLTDDDHAQYALLAGRSSGQALAGGTGTVDDLIFKTTTGVGASGADMIFQTGNNGATEAMRILYNGNIGIGTTSPTNKLQVRGKLRVEEGGSGGTGTISLGWGAQTSLQTDETVGSFRIQNYDGFSSIYRDVFYSNIYGNVGIGTSNPQRQFQLDSGAGNNSAISLTHNTSGHTSTDGLLLQYNTQGYLWNFENTNLTLATNNTARMTIQSDGNIGIGTTGPTRNLEVAGNAKITTNAAASSLWLDNLSAGGYGLLVDTSGNTSAGEFVADFRSGGASRLYVATDGNVGIGMTTPGSALSLIGAMTIDASSGVGQPSMITNPKNIANFSQFLFYPGGGTNTNMTFSVVPKGAGVSDNRSQFLVFRTDNVADPVNYEFAGLRARENDFILATGMSGTGVNRPLILSSGGLALSNLSQLVLATAGNIGIGTSSPSEKLDVYGASASGANIAMRLQNTTANGYEAVEFYNESGAKTLTFAHSNSSAGVNPASSWIGTRNAENLYFVTNGTAPRVAIDTGGNVGIGTTNPGAIYGVGSVRVLDIVGGSADAGIAIKAGSATTNGFIDLRNSAGALKGNLWVDGVSGYMGINSANTNTILNQSGGYVGIGTTTPGAALDIAGGVGRFQTTNTIPTGNVNAAEVSYYTTGGYGYLLGYNRGASTFLPIKVEGSTVALRISGNDKVTVNSSGYVGIGTTSPAATFDIGTANTAYNTTATVARITNTSATGQSPFDYYINGTLRGRTRADYAGNFTLMANGGYFSFLTGGDFGVGTDVMRINNSGGLALGSSYVATDPGAGSAIFSGSVGVRTTSPQALLHTQSNTSGATTTQGRFENLSEAGRAQFIVSSGTYPSNFFALMTHGSTFTSDNYLGGGVDAGLGLLLGQGTNMTKFAVGTYDAKPLSLFTGNAERLYIKSDGNVGIGTTTPVNQLHVYTTVMGNGLTVDGSSHPGINLAASGVNKANIGLATSATGWTADSLTGDLVFRTAATSQRMLFTVNNGTSSMLALNNGNVGIGTTLPGYNLDVVGAVNATSYYIGGALMGSVAAGSTTGQTLYWNGSVWTTNTNLFNNNANVGIGTTSPAEKLHILDGNIRATQSGSNSGQIQIGATGDAYNYSILKLMAGPNPASDKTWLIEHRKDRLNQMEFEYFNGTTYSTAVTIQSGGNVGIGTTGPTEKFAVYGASSSVNTPIARISSSGSQVPLYFTSGSGDAYIKGDSGGNFAMGAEGFMAYEAGGFGASYERMRINSDGNVGIGTTNPLRKLDINNGLASAGNGSMRVFGYQAGFEVYNAAGTSNWYFGNNDADNNNLYIGKGYGPNQGVAPNLVISSSSGNVGIGTTNPLSKLSVGGAGVANTGIYGTGSTYGIYGDSAATGVQGYGVTGVGASGTTYDFYANGSGVDYGTGSSIRWKSNIKEITGALDAVMKLQGVTYDMNQEHGGGHQIGFIGEEVGQYFPEIVSFDSTSSDPSYYVTGMDYSKMTPVLLSAIQEQQVQINDLSVLAGGLQSSLTVQDQEIQKLNIALTFLTTATTDQASITNQKISSIQSNITASGSQINFISAKLALVTNLISQNNQSKLELPFYQFDDANGQLSSLLINQEIDNNEFSAIYGTPGNFQELNLQLIPENQLDFSSYDQKESSLVYDVFIENGAYLEDFHTELGNIMDQKEIEWNKSHHPYFVSGWNEVRLPLIDGTKTGEIDWQQLNYFRAYFKLTNNANLRFKNIRIETKPSYQPLAQALDANNLDLWNNSDQGTAIKSIFTELDSMKTQDLASLQVDTKLTNDLKAMQDQVALLQKQADAFTQFLLAFDVNSIDNFAKKNAPINTFSGQLEAEGMVAGAFSVKAVKGKPKTIGEAFICPKDSQDEKCADQDVASLDGKSVSISTKVGETSAITATNKIFINFEDNPKAYSWTEKEINQVDGYTGRFKIMLDQVVSEPVKVNWWIVEEK